MYEKQTVRIRHSKGLAYIAYLIRHAGRELHVTDLATLGESDTEGSIKGATRAVDASSVDIGQYSMRRRKHLIDNDCGSFVKSGGGELARRPRQTFEN